MASKTRRSHESDDTKLSKLLSYMLRHGAEKEGLQMSDDGFVNISHLLDHKQFKSKSKTYTLEDIKKVVRENDKQRFLMKEDGGIAYIRANQGHSLSVPELDIVEIKPGDLESAVHGTYEKHINAIKENGLSRMKRQHIHMAESEPGQNGVISGMRKSCDYIVTVNIPLAQQDGLKFYRSANNVILTEGDKDGFILPKYFKSVRRRSS